MTRFLHRELGDRGSAMVAALAVALIGIALATVVMSQAIIVTRDSGRDAIRTAEIHGAEAGLDATLQALEGGYPCPGPTFIDSASNSTTIGSGADAVTVTVEIEYKDDAGALTTCVAGQILGVPTSAKVKATADPVNPPPMLIAPRRVFEMNLLLEPKTEENHGAAIFAASYLYTGAGLTLLPGAGGDLGDIYLGDGSYDCQTKVLIDGNLVVPNGKITFGSNSCSVTGDVWSQGDFDIQKAQGVTVGGNVTIENGNLISHAGTIIINGDVTVGGTGTNGNIQGDFDIGGAVTQHATTVVDKPAVLLPIINFDPNDWTTEDPPFVVRYTADWKYWMMNNATTASVAASYGDHPCLLKQNELGKKPFDMPSTPTVFDLRDCPATTTGVMADNQSIQFNLYADTAFILKGWDDQGSVTVTDGDPSDGAEHRFFIIVPYGEPGAGDINLHSGSNVMPPIEVFLYSPEKVIFHNDSYTHGQVYGGHVEVNSGANFYYTPADIPGADLTTEPTVVGSNVIIVNKREVG